MLTQNNCHCNLKTGYVQKKPNRTYPPCWTWLWASHHSMYHFVVHKGPSTNKIGNFLLLTGLLDYWPQTALFFTVFWSKIFPLEILWDIECLDIFQIMSWKCLIENWRMTSRDCALDVCFLTSSPSFSGRPRSCRFHLLLYRANSSILFSSDCFPHSLNCVLYCTFYIL